jgi:hypothetical protein
MAPLRPKPRSSGVWGDEEQFGGCAFCTPVQSLQAFSHAERVDTAKGVFFGPFLLIPGLSLGLPRPRPGEQKLPYPL